MTILGAILAGGRSSRFGSDKALALLDGRRLIDVTVASLAIQVDGIVVCGREDRTYDCVADRPSVGLGPLGGLCAALHRAKLGKYDAVLSAGCDTPFLPTDLAKRLGSAGPPSACQSLPLIGLWPVGLAAMLDQHLAMVEDRSMRCWMKVCGANAVAIEGLLNINFPNDLMDLAADGR